MGWGPGDPLQIGWGLPRLVWERPRGGEGDDKIACVQLTAPSLDVVWPTWIEVEREREKGEGPGRRGTSRRQARGPLSLHTNLVGKGANDFPRPPREELIKLPSPFSRIISLLRS